MRKSVLLLFVILIHLYSSGQEKNSHHPAPIIKKQNLISGAAVFSLGNFSSTHFAGFIVDYSRCHYGYRKSNVKLPALLSYTVNTGINYFLGKKETVSGYTYNYPGNTWLYAMGGIMVVPATSLNIGITAGPALVIYNKNNAFAFTSKLEIGYFIKKKIAVSPLLQFLKEGRATAHWIAGIKGGLAF
jgi:hypothetical protein